MNPHVLSWGQVAIIRRMIENLPTTQGICRSAPMHSEIFCGVLFGKPSAQFFPKMRLSGQVRTFWNLRYALPVSLWCNIHMAVRSAVMCLALGFLVRLTQSFDCLTY